MPAGIYNAYIEKGATWCILLRLTDSDGLPLNLTGYTGAAQIRTSASATVVIASPTVAFASPRTLGEITLSLTATQTKALVTAGLRYQETTNCVWEFDLTAPDGTVLRLLNGDAYISPGGIQS